MSDRPKPAPEAESARSKQAAILTFIRTWVEPIALVVATIALVITVLAYKGQIDANAQQR